MPHEEVRLAAWRRQVARTGGVLRELDSRTHSSPIGESLTIRDLSGPPWCLVERRLPDQRPEEMSGQEPIPASLSD